MSDPFIDLFRNKVRERLAQVGERSAGDHVLNPHLPDFYASKPREAAVLIPVVNRASGATVLLTRRTDHLPSHAGQIAFPGGKIDDGDEGPVAAALREAHEEVGLERGFVDALGMLSPYMTGSGYKVVPVIAIVDPAMRLCPNPGEVSEIFEAPLSFLMDPANHLTHSRVWGDKSRSFYAIPYGERYIWGVTAGILRLMYETVYD